MVELLEVFTSSVDCQGDDGQMSLTSKPQEAPDYAHSKWALTLGVTGTHGVVLG